MGTVVLRKDDDKFLHLFFKHLKQTKIVPDDVEDSIFVALLDLKRFDQVNPMIFVFDWQDWLYHLRFPK